MIREILEKNGFEILLRKETYCDFVYNYYIAEKDKEITHYEGFKDDEELACRQYVEEYGFKASWFEKMLKDLKNDNITLKQKLYDYHVPHFGIGTEIEISKQFKEGDAYVTTWIVDNKFIGVDTKFSVDDKEISNIAKLIAWLYANDIKIINDLIEKTNC